MSLLIAGGALDPNLELLLKACRELNVPAVDARHRPGESPAFEWDLTGSGPFLNEEPLQVRAAFIRYDVFESIEEARRESQGRAAGWYQTLHGWLLASPRVRLFNRSASAVSANKPAMLVAARDAGLRIPQTLISNRESRVRLAGRGGHVAKPVAGGDYCQTVEQSLEHTTFRQGVASCPAFIQPRLIAPEVRVYVIGSRDFAFEMRSPSLDYRRKQDVDVLPMPAVPDVARDLRRLMASVQMDYGAADFKTDPDSGELQFLELNSSPMFARFDLEVRGALTRGIVQELLSDGRP